MQLPPSDHEKFQLLVEDNLWVLAMDAEEIVLGEECASLGANVLRPKVILNIEESWDHELFIEHALD